MKYGLSLSVIVFCATAWACWPTSAKAGDFWKLELPVTAPAKAAHRVKPETYVDPPIEQLANQIDWLEHYIDEFGTIVPKAPDVWGQSRLTAHREEYETVMKAELNNFAVLYQGSLARNDMAYLGFALALQGAAAKPPAQPRTISRALTGGLARTSTGPTVNVNESMTSPAPPSAGGGPAAATLPPFAFGNPTGSANFTPPFGLNSQAQMTALGFGSAGLSIEPTLRLDELSRYLEHLHALRRINEGSDTNDSPGYALDLVRVPISVLPGKKTRKGYGAEITITATPYLTPELLPGTFRDLVTNDLIDQLAPALTQWANDPEVVRLVRRLREGGEGAGRSCKQVAEINEALKVLSGWANNPTVDQEGWAKLWDAVYKFRSTVDSLDPANACDTTKLRNQIREFGIAATNWKSKQELLEIQTAQAARQTLVADAAKELNAPKAPKELTAWVKMPANGADFLLQSLKSRQSRDKKSDLEMDMAIKTVTNLCAAAEAQSKAESAMQAQTRGLAAGSEAARRSASSLTAEAATLIKRISTSVNQLPLPLAAPGTRMRRAYLPIPPRQILDIFGERMIAEMLVEIRRGLAQNPEDRGVIQLMDVRGFLDDEVHAAYLFLDTENQTGQPCLFPVGTIDRASRRAASSLPIATPKQPRGGVKPAAYTGPSDLPDPPAAAPRMSTINWVVESPPKVEAAPQAQSPGGDGQVLPALQTAPAADGGAAVVVPGPSLEFCPPQRGYWESCTRDLAIAVRAAKMRTVLQKRNCFLRAVGLDQVDTCSKCECGRGPAARCRA